jgi:hypothetical protein
MEVSGMASELVVLALQTSFGVLTAATDAVGVPAFTRAYIFPRPAAPLVIVNVVEE